MTVGSPTSANAGSGSTSSVNATEAKQNASVQKKAHLKRTLSTIEAWQGIGEVHVCGSNHLRAAALQGPTNQNCPCQVHLCVTFTLLTVYKWLVSLCKESSWFKVPAPLSLEKDSLRYKAGKVSLGWMTTATWCGPSPGMQNTEHTETESVSA